MALELLLSQRLKQPGAHPSGRHDVDVLHRLKLLARHGIADGRMVGADGAGEPFVLQVLDDEVVGRVTVSSSRAAATSLTLARLRAKVFA